MKDFFEALLWIIIIILVFGVIGYILQRLLAYTSKQTNTTYYLGHKRKFATPDMHDKFRETDKIIAAGLKSDFIAIKEKLKRNNLFKFNAMDSKISKLEKLANIKKSGVLTEEEFESLKKEILNI